MKILPVNIFSTRNTTQSSGIAVLPKLKPMPYDSVSFSANQPVTENTEGVNTRPPMSAKAYRKLSKYLVDFYTGLPMLEDKQLTKMKQRGFFTGPIKDVVHKLKPYYNDGIFEPVEQEVFEKIMKAAESNPNMDLTSLFNTWYIAARKNLRKIQRPTFDKIKELGAQLPPDKMQEFYRFMAQTDRMLYDEPVLKEFSHKDFMYKMEKFIYKLPEGSQTQQRMGKLLRQLQILHEIQGDVPEQFVKEIYDFKNMKVAGKKSLYYEKHLKPLEKDKDALRLKLINDIGIVAEKGGYKKIHSLCQRNMDMLNGVPVRIPFSNKAFKYDLSEILADIEDKELKHKMLNLADELPTSRKSADALILKLKDADPNIIGDRLLNPSLVSIEHLVPQSLGGPDTMANCAMARRSINSRRGNEPLYITLQNYDPKNQQKYAECVVKLQKHGKIPYEDALEHFETIERLSHGRVDLSVQKAKLDQTVKYVKDRFAKKH